jgi:uncharacterized membrane protein HdeD (DUF308 family)
LVEVVEKGLKRFGVTVSKPALGVICILFGILVLLIPELLQLIVGLFLIIEGVLVLTDYLEIRSQQSSSKFSS